MKLGTVDIIVHIVSGMKILPDEWKDNSKVGFCRKQNGVTTPFTKGKPDKMHFSTNRKPTFALKSIVEHRIMEYITAFIF